MCRVSHTNVPFLQVTGCDLSIMFVYLIRPIIRKELRQTWDKTNRLIAWTALWSWLTETWFCATDIEVVLLVTYFQTLWTCLSIYTFPINLNSSIKSLFFMDVIPPKWRGNASLPSSWLGISAVSSGARTHSLCLCNGAAYECTNREAQIAQPFAS